MVHGLNEGHIAPYTDIEFQLTKYQTYIKMKSQDKEEAVVEWKKQEAKELFCG